MSKKILPMLLVFFMLLGLTGCGKSGEEAKKTCQEFFEAYAAADGAMAEKYLVGGFASGELTPMQSALAERTSVKIKAAKADGDSAEVKVVISCIDVVAVIKNLPEDIDSEEQAKAALISAFTKEDVPTRETEVKVQMVNTDGKWLVSMSAELSDALLGGFQTMINEMTQGAAG